MSPSTDTVRIDLGERSYDILIGSGLLGDPARYAGLPDARDAVIVSNDTVAPLYHAAVARALAVRYRRVHLVSLPDGEHHKDWTTLNRVFDAMLSAGCDRK